MPDRLRWGILGTGNIAGQFAQALAGSHRGRLAAVGSRRADSARQFAADNGAEAAHGAYDALLADPNVEAVYNALPNALHHAWTLQALAGGKHVLCEKPFATNAAQSEEMFDAARTAGRVLVEAFMYRSHPLTAAVVQALRAGSIGQLHLIRTSFCYATRKVDGNVRFSTELAGGALMDIGAYCVSFARLAAGAEPTNVHATAHMHASGVDVMAAGTLQFPGNVLASFTCGMNAHADNSAFLCGSEGYIQVPVPWKPPVQGAAYTIARMAPPRQDNPRSDAGPTRETFHVDAEHPLYALEADDFAATVQDGAAPAVSRDDTLGNMRVLDELRRQVGLGF